MPSFYGKRGSFSLSSLPNGSRIVGLPGKEANIRGYSANLLIIDEASRVPDDLYKALSSDGDC